MRFTNNLLQNGRYQILRAIGQGGMGAVYEAYDRNLNYKVAVKQVQVDNSGPLLVREGQRLVRLRHVALPDVKNHFVEGQEQYLVMEYIEGHDLAEQLNQQGHPFAVESVLMWADRLLDALTYLHSRQPPIIHRDIKPANLKLTPDGQIILLDFGLAKGGLTQQTINASLHGFTLTYAPPEQIAGTGTDERSDLYALAATLYHLLTNQRPINARRRYVEGVDSDPLRPANELNPQVPADVADVLTRAMALDPAQRPASAEQMRAMLAQSLLSDQRQPQQAKIIAPNRSRWMLPLITVLLVVMIGTALTLNFNNSSLPSEPLPTISTNNPFDVTPLARLGKGKIEQIAISPNNNQLAVASSVGIFLYDAQTLEELLVIESHVGLKSIAFSPDGQIMAAGSQNGIIQLWQVDGQLLESLEGHTQEVTSIAISPDGQRLASGSLDQTVRLWQLPQAESEADNRNDPYLMSLPVGTKVSRIAFSPDGQLLASASFDDSKVHLWQLSDGKILRTLVGHDSEAGVNSVLFTPDGQRIVSASSDKTVRLWQVSDGKELLKLEHASNVRSIAISPDGETLASGVDDNKVYLSRLSDGTPVGTLDRHTNKIPSVAFSSDGQILVTGSFDHTVRLWQVSNGKLLKTQSGYTDSIRSVAVSPDGQVIASGSVDGTVRLWQSSDGTLLATLEGHTHAVTSVAFSPDGQTVASGSEDQTVRLWHISGSPLQTLDGHTDKVTSVAFSSDGQLLASGSVNGTIYLWQLDGQPLQRLEGHTESVTSVAFSPDGQTLASGSQDQTVRLWQVSDRTLLATLEGHTYRVNSVAFSPNGQTVASGSADTTVRVWQLPDGERFTTLERHNRDVRSVAFSADSQTVASGSVDGMLHLWRVSDRVLLSTLEGHTSSVNSIVFSPDGKIISGSQDGTVRLWGVLP